MNPIMAKFCESSDVNYTLRRFFVDEFFHRQADIIATGSLILDLGGNKIGKRGHFDIERYSCHVVYANLSDEKRPDVRADAARLPFRSDTFDTVICAELLEHVYEYDQVIGEVFRILKPGGLLLASVPFHFPLHADPNDYLRFSDTFLRRLLSEHGFEKIRIERQGGYWSVLADMVRGLTCEFLKGFFLRRLIARLILSRIATTLRKRAIKKDGQELWKTVYLNGFAVGFGIVAAKPKQGKTDEN